MYEVCVHFIGIIVLHIDLNKNLNMQNDVEFHRLSKYVHLITISLKLQTTVDLFQRSIISDLVKFLKLYLYFCVR